MYFRWHVVNGAAPYLSKPFVDEDFAFNRKYLRGIAEQRPRWKRCVGDVDNLLGEALGEEFVRRTFAEKTKQDTLHMTELIEKAMAQEINGLDWMSPETKTTGADQAAQYSQQGGLSRQVARLQRGSDHGQRLSSEITGAQPRLRCIAT